MQMKMICEALTICLLAGLFGGCGAEPAKENPKSGEPSGESYEIPEFQDAVFHRESAEGNGSVFIDLSAVDEGYIAVSATSDKRMKLQVLMGEETYTYDIASDGTPSVFPLQCGNGSYTVRFMEHVVDNKYAVAYDKTFTVALVDEFQPYLRPSDYASYSRDSECVQKAMELAEGCHTSTEVIEQIYKYVTKSVKYDKEKAATVQSGYLPDPDETLRTGKGICFDYASLAAAMLRSLGIPTKVIFGYVAPNDIYHAWNMFYTEETGWTVVKFTVEEDNWCRMDLTFSANGSDNRFIGNGDNYAEVYHY